jgi:hypothetical protein
VLLSSVVFVVVGTVIALSLSGNESHFLLHLVVALPVLVLVWLVATSTPRARRSPAARWARSLLLTGLSLFGGGALIEATGAFGYTDSDRRANDLALLHSVGVAVTPLGIVLTLAGTVTSCAVAVAARRGAADSRYAAAGVVLAAVAAVAFVAGGMIFGY